MIVDCVVVGQRRPNADAVVVCDPAVDGGVHGGERRLLDGVAAVLEVSTVSVRTTWTARPSMTAFVGIRRRSLGAIVTEISGVK